MPVLQVERTGVGYEPFTPEQQQGVFNMLDRYVAADEASEEEVLSINSFRDILEVQCKFEIELSFCTIKFQQHSLVELFN